MNAAPEFTHRFDEAYTAAVNQAQPDWMRKRRGQAYARFQQAGLPSTRQEDWKYTSLAGLDRYRFDTNEHAGQAGLPATAFDQLNAHRVVYMAGRPVPEWLSIHNLPEGVTLMPLEHALAESRPAAVEFFGRLTEDGEPLSDFNTALWRDGIYLEVARDVHVQHPIHLLSLGLPGKAAQLRHLLVLGEHSRAEVIEHGMSIGDGAHFGNGVTESLVGAHAELIHIAVQEENEQSFHIARMAAKLGSGSRYGHLSLAAGGALTRNDVVIRLDGEGAECTLNGLTLGQGRRHADHHTFVDHRVPGGISRQLYKGVLRDRSRAVFNGRVRVAAGAVKTDARQVNRNLLLSRDAEADSKPQLEIFADDVKCSHGSATGGLDAEQLFYLRSRGLPEAEARALLMHAYASEVLTVAADPGLNRALDGWLRHKLEMGDE
jgi:Fe-S cluster assembly protein SufD